MKIKNNVQFTDLSKMASTVNAFYSVAEILRVNDYSVDNWHNNYGYNRRYINKYDDNGNKVKLGFIDFNASKQVITLELNCNEDELIVEICKTHNLLKKLVN